MLECILGGIKFYVLVWTSHTTEVNSCLPSTALNLQRCGAEFSRCVAHSRHWYLPLPPTNRSGKGSQAYIKVLKGTAHAREKHIQMHTVIHMSVYRNTYINMYMNMYTNMNMYRYVSEAWPANLLSSVCSKIFLYLTRLSYFLVSFSRYSFFSPLTNCTCLPLQTHSLASNPQCPTQLPSQTHGQCVISSSPRKIRPQMDTCT